MPTPTDTNPNPQPGSTATSTVLILLVALAMRLLVLRSVLTAYPAGWLYTRGMEMGLLARSIIQGQGLASPFGPPTGPTAFVAPGYPLLVAAVFRLFGTYSTTSAIFIILAQTALNLITIWLMMHIARQLFNRTVAILAGIVWACSFPIVWMPTIFWDTSIAICLMVGLFALVLRYRTRATLPVWIGLGAYCAITALINPAMIPMLAATLLWLAWQHRHTNRYGILAAAFTFCVVFSPWPIRNARVFHAFIPLRTTVGFELWMGNRDGATGFLDESLFPSFNAAELSDYTARGELGYTANKSNLARHYILSHPGTFLRLTSVRVARYWLGTGSKGGSAIFALHAAVTSVLGFIGLWMLYRHRRFALVFLFAMPLLLFPLPYYITHAEFRYRLALDPLLTILAAYAVASLFRSTPKPGEAALG